MSERGGAPGGPPPFHRGGQSSGSTIQSTR